MKVPSRYSKGFQSVALSETKYREIEQFAKRLNMVKNEVSKEVNHKLLNCLDMSKFDFQKTFLPMVKEKVHSNFVKQMLDDIYVAYQNKFEMVNSKLRF